VAYADRGDLLSGAGSSKHGARWNTTDRFNVAYGSLTPNADVAESLGTLNDFRVPPAQARWRVFVAIALRLHMPAVPIRTSNS